MVTLRSETQQVVIRLCPQRQVLPTGGGGGDRSLLTADNGGKQGGGGGGLWTLGHSLQMH